MKAQFTFLCLLWSMLVATVFSQFLDGESPECPSRLGHFFKDCKGNSEECAVCLGNAEVECFYPGNSYKECGRCASALVSACNSARKTCFGKADCEKNENCLANFTCMLLSDFYIDE